MNREIKFRAWSALANQMHQCDMEEDIQDYFKHDDGIFLMQYTGLKDKNGKEIYEGDILNIYDWGTFSKNELISIAEVVWDIDEHGWNWKTNLGIYSGTKNFEIDNYDRWRNVEIIGNVHENTDLL